MFLNQYVDTMSTLLNYISLISIAVKEKKKLKTKISILFIFPNSQNFVSHS